eukprot:3179116-Rhodomonas_salina.4
MEVTNEHADITIEQTDVTTENQQTGAARAVHAVGRAELGGGVRRPAGAALAPLRAPPPPPGSRGRREAAGALQGGSGEGVVEGRCYAVRQLGYSALRLLCYA